METLEVVLEERVIQDKVREMAAAISADAAGKPLHVVGLLESGFIFMADLVRHLTCQAICHFTKFEMRDVQVDGMHERRQIDYRLPLDVAGQDVLIVDCILQTGITLDHLVCHLMSRGSKSVRAAVLLDKAEERRVDAPADYVGFRLEGDQFLVGYGMGCREMYRNLPYIASIKKATRVAKA